MYKSLTNQVLLLVFSNKKFIKFIKKKYKTKSYNEIN